MTSIWEDFEHISGLAEEAALGALGIKRYEDLVQKCSDLLDDMGVPKDFPWWTTEETPTRLYYRLLYLKHYLKERYGDIFNGTEET